MSTEGVRRIRDCGEGPGVTEGDGDVHLRLTCTSRGKPPKPDLITPSPSLTRDVIRWEGSMGVLDKRIKGSMFGLNHPHVLVLRVGKADECNH